MDYKILLVVIVGCAFVLSAPHLCYWVERLLGLTEKPPVKRPVHQEIDREADTRPFEYVKTLDVKGATPPLLAKFGAHALKVLFNNGEDYSDVLFEVEDFELVPGVGLVVSVKTIRGNYTSPKVNIAWLTFFPKHLKGLEHCDLA